MILGMVLLANAGMLVFAMFQGLLEEEHSWRKRQNKEKLWKIGGAVLLAVAIPMFIMLGDFVFGWTGFQEKSRLNTDMLAGGFFVGSWMLLFVLHANKAKARSIGILLLLSVAMAFFWSAMDTSSSATWSMARNFEWRGLRKVRSIINGVPF